MNTNNEDLTVEFDPYDFEQDRLAYPSIPPGLIIPSGSRFAPSINTRTLLPSIQELSESAEPSPVRSSADAPSIPPGLEGLTPSSAILVQTRDGERISYPSSIQDSTPTAPFGSKTRRSLSSDMTKELKNEDSHGKGEEGEFVSVSVHSVEDNAASDVNHNSGGVSEGRIEGNERRISVLGRESGTVVIEKELELRKSWSFWLSFVAINISIFISAMNFMAIGTVLPTVASALGDKKGDFTWIGAAYALSTTSFIPISATMSDIFGRKPILLICIVCFALGSALAGAARSMTTMIAAQAVQGVGGGGMISVTAIIISDLVPLAQRAKFQSVLGLTWSIASAVAPTIGGALASNGHTTWRWLFYLNLPLAGVAGSLFGIFLNVRHPEGSYLNKLRRVDWIGNAIIVSGCVLTTIGLAWGGVRFPWDSASVLAPLVVGFVLMIIFGLYEVRFPKQPTILPDLFKNRTTVGGLMCTAAHGIASIALIFYMPIYFQAVLGHSPIHSAVDFLPSVLVIVTASFAAGVLITSTGFYRPPIYAGWALMMIGFGLLSTLNETSSTGKWVGYQVITGVGAGLLYPTPNFPILAPLSKDQVASALSLSNFIRAFAQTWGITMGSTILQNQLKSSLPASTEFPGNFSIAFSAIRVISTLPEDLRIEVRATFANSLAVIWQTMIGICGLGLLGTLLMKEVKTGCFVDSRSVLKDGLNEDGSFRRTGSRDPEMGISMEVRQSRT